MNKHFTFALLLGASGLLRATVISEEELEAHKRQLIPSKVGNSLMMGWQAQPDV